MNEGIEGGGPIRRPVVGDEAFFRGLAARTLADFAKNLAEWAIQPHPEPLPEGWADANRRRLNDARELVQQNFAGQSSVLRELQEFAEDARELIIILQSDPGISTKPVQDWPIQAYRDAFERVKAGQQKFRRLADRLLAEDETSREELQQWRRSLNQAARRAALASTGIGRIENPFEKARRVLEEFGWVEGVEPPFDPAGVAFDPAAVQAWGFCVDAVADLPECSGGMLGISRQLQFRFDSTHSRPVGGGTAGVIWRWENPPSGPWVNRHELQALKIAGAEWERQQSRAPVESETQPAGRAIVEGPQTSPQGALGAQPDSTPSASPDGAADPQGASGVVEWSKPRSPKVWRQMLKELEHPPFTEETAWKENVKRDPASFRGPFNHRRITRAKAEEWGLRLPEFGNGPK